MRVALHTRAIGALALAATLGAAAPLAGAQQPQTPIYSATPAPVAPQPAMAPVPLADGAEPWRNVVPERGVVVSGDGTAYGVPPPPVVYAPPVYAAPVYVHPGWGWPQPYLYPPVGISLNLGYSRGWRGGGYGRWHHHGRWR